MEQAFRPPASRWPSASRGGCGRRTGPRTLKEREIGGYTLKSESANVMVEQEVTVKKRMGVSNKPLLTDH